MSEPALTSEALFAPTLPRRYQPALEALAELDRLIRSAADESRRAAEAQELYARLLQIGRSLAEPLPPELGPVSPELGRWFSEAVLLWMRFSETGSAPLVDSVGSVALPDFPLDLPMDSAAHARLRAALGVAFGWSEPELSELERRVLHLTSNLSLKRALTGACAERALPRASTPRGRVELMQELYGPVPWRPGDVDLVVTSTAILFCVPGEQSRLLVDDWNDRSREEREAIATFLERLEQANVAETRRFPAFGLFDVERVDPALLDALVARVGERRDVVAATLATMVSVLPTHKLAQYLIHDTWGHPWQEALSEFEWEYAYVPKLDAELSPADGPELAGAGTPSLADSFAVVGGRTQLDEALLCAVVRADLGARLQIGASVALSEMLADFMESKFARAHPQVGLPTSSLMPAERLRLDLTLGDLRRQVLRASGPYRAFCEDGAVRERFAAALASSGLPERGARAAIERAALRIRECIAPALSVELFAEVDGTELVSSAFRRLMLSFLLISSELERALDRALPVDGRARWTDPGSCADLFALSAIHFYEQDRRRHFWHLDQAMRDAIPPACERLRAALDLGQGPG